MLSNIADTSQRPNLGPARRVRRRVAKRTPNIPPKDMPVGGTAVGKDGQRYVIVVGKTGRKFWRKEATQMRLTAPKRRRAKNLPSEVGSTFGTSPLTFGDLPVVRPKRAMNLPSDVSSAFGVPSATKTKKKTKKKPPTKRKRRRNKYPIAPVSTTARMPSQSGLKKGERRKGISGEHIIGSKASLKSLAKNEGFTVRNDALDLIVSSIKGNPDLREKIMASAMFMARNSQKGDRLTILRRDVSLALQGMKSCDTLPPGISHKAVLLQHMR